MSDFNQQIGQGGLKVLPSTGSEALRVESADWQFSGSDGFWIKPLLEDADAGLRTWLMKVDPGAYSPPHAHEDIEQIYLLEGSFYDDERSYGPGDYIVRAAGAEHSAGSHDGALMILIYTPDPT